MSDDEEIIEYEYISRVQTAANAVDADDKGQAHELITILDQFSTLLARSLRARRNTGNATNPSIWPSLRRLWDVTLSKHTHTHPQLGEILENMTVSLAKFTRNLTAAIPSNQEKAFDNESTIRHLIYHYTSYSATQDPSSYPAARTLTEALSNIITNNDAIAQRLWLTYLHLPDEQLILTRLFASPDPRTVSAAFVLLLNCIHGNVQRTYLLADGPSGPRICVALLDRIASLFEAESSSEEGHAFDIGYEIFSRAIEAGLAGKLYTKLAVEDEVITPHQTTLLKLLDAFLHASKRADEVGSSRQLGTDRTSLLDMLAHLFIEIATYARRSIQKALGPGSQAVAEGVDATDAKMSTTTGAARKPADSPRVQASEDGPAPLQEFDLLLPKVCEAFVLVTQCLTTIALRAEEAVHGRTNDAGQPSPRTVMVTTTSSANEGFVEFLIEILRLVDAFVPRITYGKVVRRPSVPNEQCHANTIDSSVDAGADTMPVANANGGADMQAAPEAQTAQAAQAFAHVKRDLVRLLGILASRDRAVQDRVRGCGGIPVVMNLCVVDDYNPYLREHAIFALRNLLDGNLENQSVVDAMKAVGRWDEEKILREVGSGGSA